jgi:hypothetical protein
MKRRLHEVYEKKTYHQLHRMSFFYHRRRNSCGCFMGVQDGQDLSQYFFVFLSIVGLAVKVSVWTNGYALCMMSAFGIGWILAVFERCWSDQLGLCHIRIGWRYMSARWGGLRSSGLGLHALELCVFSYTFSYQSTGQGIYILGRFGMDVNGDACLLSVFSGAGDIKGWEMNNCL